MKLIESHELQKQQDPVGRRCPKSLIHIQYLPFDLSIKKGTISKITDNTTA